MLVALVSINSLNICRDPQPSISKCFGEPTHGISNQHTLKPFEHSWLTQDEAWSLPDVGAGAASVQDSRSAARVSTARSGTAASSSAPSALFVIQGMGQGKS